MNFASKTVIAAAAGTMSLSVVTTTASAVPLQLSPVAIETASTDYLILVGGSGETKQETMARERDARKAEQRAAREEKRANR